MEKRPVAYQIYSARDDAQRDLNAVLQSLAQMGYQGVEFAGFYGHDAKDVKAMLEKHGLFALSSHVPYALLQEDLFGVISYHLAIGCHYIAIPYLDETTRPGSAGFAAVIGQLHHMARIMREAGITLLYHNHDFEFTQISGQYGLDFLYDALPASLLQTEIDVCWVHYAGVDPADYLRRYAGRTPVVHLKDYVGTKDGGTPYALIGLDEGLQKQTGAFEFKPVGHGCQDIKAIVLSAIAGGAKWFVVEQDESHGRTPLEAAQMSIDYLKSINLV